MQLPKNRNRDLRLNRFHYVAINSPLILNMSVLQVDVAARKNPLKNKRETTVRVNMVMKREVTQLSPRNEAKQNKRVNNSNNDQKSRRREKAFIWQASPACVALLFYELKIAWRHKQTQQKRRDCGLPWILGSWGRILYTSLKHKTCLLS